MKKENANVSTQPPPAGCVKDAARGVGGPDKEGLWWWAGRQLSGGRQPLAFKSSVNRLLHVSSGQWLHPRSFDSALMERQSAETAASVWVCIWVCVCVFI